ncbi:uncharacterized protein LOC143299961 [Babylonia areolata]|uniref:uncharacterized protein LOC143299961 n=1 Tax=Babylonia areolata TaxID=304850 RepID=UPI003FD20075
MPSWGILKNAKDKRRRAHKVQFKQEDQDAGHSDPGSRSSSVGSNVSDQDVQHVQQGPTSPTHNRHDLSHDDIEDEEEKRCLRHLDQLGMALEKTFKNVETIDAYVKKLRYDFDHEMVPEIKYMSCICSAKLARAACCKKQIEVWQQLQHDMQELRCHHHHSPSRGSASCVCEDSLMECPDPVSDSDCSSISTSGSQDTSDTEVILSHLNKMVLFDVVRQRLDPSADSRTFVEHWVLNHQLADSNYNNGGHASDSPTAQTGDSPTAHKGDSHSTEAQS